MRVNRHIRLAMRIQSVAVVLALLVVAGLAAWASLTWQYTADWSYGHRNSLTGASRKLLAQLSEPVTLTAFVRPGSNLAGLERRLLERYRRADPKIRLRFVNPDVALAELRSLGITTPGEIYVSYGAHGTKIDDVSESGISNALLRLARGADERVVFVDGHGEADPAGKRNYDLGNFGAALQRQGIDVVTRNLGAKPAFPENTALVVVAGPQQNYLPGEVAALEDWIARGGNLLWLRNPGPLRGLGPLAHALGVEPLDGTIVDTTSHRLGIDNPAALVISDYGKTPVTQDFRLTTLIPNATGFEPRPGSSWHAEVFLHSRRLPASWLMKGGIGAAGILYRPGTDVPGPVPIGITLSRPSPSGTGAQRAAVVGDVDFLSNSFLGNGGNLELGLNLVNWLVGENRYIDISSPQAPDRTLELSRLEQGVIGLGFLAGLPLLFLIIAAAVWLRRRRR